MDQFSDEARRCSDIVNSHLFFNKGCAGRFVAIRLSDGGSDGTLYDTKADAIRHQLHETQCVYVCITPDGMSPRAAASYLSFNRELYDSGNRMVDPDIDIVMPHDYKPGR